jgi:hypothetical protein
MTEEAKVGSDHGDGIQTRKRKTKTPLKALWVVEAACIQADE